MCEIHEIVQFLEITCGLLEEPEQIVIADVEQQMRNNTVSLVVV